MRHSRPNPESREENTLVFNLSGRKPILTPDTFFDENAGRNLDWLGEAKGQQSIEAKTVK